MPGPGCSLSLSPHTLSHWLTCTALPLEADPAAVPPTGGSVGTPAHRSLLHPETTGDHQRECGISRAQPKGVNPQLSWAFTWLAMFESRKVIVKRGFLQVPGREL